MSIAGQQNASDLYLSSQELKARVQRVRTNMQDVVNYVAVIQALPAYASGASAGDKTLITNVGSTAANIVTTIDGINWPF